MTDENNGGTPPATPSWFIDEGIPGVGDRPEWLGEKFKSAADLAKSYNELEKRVGTAPDAYDFSKSKYIDPEFASFKELQDYAKNKRVPQDVMDKVIESVDKYLDEFSTDEQAEYQKLGSDYKQRLTLLDNWAKANLSAEAHEALTKNVRTADGIKAIEEIRKKMMDSGSKVPNGNEGSSDNGITIADIQKEMSLNLDKYKTDPVYRAELQARIAIAAKSSGYVDKTAS